MNKFVSGAIVSLGVSLGAQQATAGDFSQAFSPGALFDAVTQNTTPPKDPKQEITQVQLKTTNEVFQLVGNNLITTTYDHIKGTKFYDCRVVNGYKIYLATKKHILPGDNFDKISPAKIQEIKNAPQCPIMQKLK